MFTTRDRLKKQATKVTKDLHQMADIAGNGVRKNLRQLSTIASDRYEQGRGKVQQAECAVEHFIQKRPLKSVLIAAVVGVVFGGFLVRRITTARARTQVPPEIIVCVRNSLHKGELQ